MKNEIRFTLELKQRPKLAQEIGDTLGVAPHYERVPSCAYNIAGYRLDKEGVLHIPEGTMVHNVELKPGKGGQMARSAGSRVQILGREGVDGV